LHIHGSLFAGQRVLIHGGAGGVGSFAVQLAKHFGAETIATTSALNARFVKELGADRVIDYTDEPFDSFIYDVDLVLDTRRDTRALMERTEASCFHRGEALAGKRSRAGARAIYFIVEPTRDHLAQLGKFADDGWFQPIVSAVFRLERDAYKLGLQGHHRGKIVLRVD
jgi:NADPH:quinone reductase-like Zn-dependent oxidoreductase